jgi:hypothetical protein
MRITPNLSFQRKPYFLAKNPRRIENICCMLKAQFTSFDHNRRLALSLTLKPLQRGNFVATAAYALLDLPACEIPYPDLTNHKKTN